MKQEQVMNLSDYEIVDFMGKLKCNPIHKDIGFYNIASIFTILLVGVSSGIASLLGPAMGLFTLSMEVLFSCIAIVGICAVCCIPFFIRSIKLKKELLKFSNGKITYKQFKQLKENGTLKEWENAFSKEIELKSFELMGITVEQYCIDTENAIIKDVKQKLNESSRVAKLDSNRVADEVKKIIDESNERQG